VVRATRRGEAVGDPLLAPAVVEYADGLHRIAAEDRLRRPLILLVTVLAVALAGYDTVTAPTGVFITSWLVAALLLADLVWWPRSRARLLERAAWARKLARSAPDTDRPGAG
jgi:Flp pilus assembly protein TadB